MGNFKEYKKLPVEEYNAIKAVRNSRLKELVRSPRHYQYFTTHESPRTPEMEFGTMFHVYIFEDQAEFDRRYFFIDEAKRPDKKHGMAAARNVEWLAMEMDRAGQNCDGAYTQEDLLRMELMKASILENPIAAQLLGEEGECEYSAVFDYPVEYFDDNKGYSVMRNIQMKIRLDKYIARNVFGTRVIVDLKTTKDGDPDIYDRAAWELGYHRAAAIYGDAVEAEEFYLIVIEKTAPYVCCVYLIDDSLINKGRHDEKTGYIKLLTDVAKCRDLYGSEFSTDSKQWPGYEWKADNDGNLLLKAPFYK